jgi:hypothetical protein
MAFKPAVRSEAFIKMAVIGISGSGKSWSALLIAKGLAGDGKIAVLDTENSSSNLYEKLCKFDIEDIREPFSVIKYINAIKDAYKLGYKVLIIDSITPEWSGVGGILDQHQLLATSTKNSFTTWAAMTPVHNKFIQAILQTPMHIICTVRAETGYEIKEGKPLKIGLKPDQRKGVEFEFTLVFDIAGGSHLATASKDRTGLFEGDTFVPTVETGVKIKEWLESATPVEQGLTPEPVPVTKPYVLKTKIDINPESIYDSVIETQEDVPTVVAFVSAVPDKEALLQFVGTMSKEMVAIKTLSELKTYWEKHSETSEFKALSKMYRDQITATKDRQKDRMRGVSEQLKVEIGNTDTLLIPEPFDN